MKNGDGMRVAPRRGWFLNLLPRWCPPAAAYSKLSLAGSAALTVKIGFSMVLLHASAPVGLHALPCIVEDESMGGHTLMNCMQSSPCSRRRIRPGEGRHKGPASVSTLPSVPPCTNTLRCAEHRALGPARPKATAATPCELQGA